MSDDWPMPGCGYRYMVAWCDRDDQGPWMKPFETTEQVLAFIAEKKNVASGFSVSCIYDDED